MGGDVGTSTASAATATSKSLYKPEHRFKLRIGLGKQGSVPVEHAYVTHDDQIPEVVEWLRANQTFGWDYETSGLDHWTDKVATLQIGNPLIKNPMAWVIDTRCISRAVLDGVLAFVEDERYKKLGQNLSFECKFSHTNFGVGPKNLVDCQVAELVLRAGLFPAKKSKGASGEASRVAYGHTSMAALCQRYMGITLDKDFTLRTSFYKTPPGMHNRRQITYAAGDTIYPFYIALKQRELRDARKLKRTLKVEFAMIPLLAAAELRGINIDQAAWRELWQEAEAHRLEALDALDDHFRGLTVQGDLFNPEAETRPIYQRTNKELNYGSPDQVKWILREWCAANGWSREIIITIPRLQKLKRVYGREWLDKQQRRGRDVTVDDVPNYVLPEERFCVLLDTNKDTLKLAKIRKQLPADIVDRLVQYSESRIRANTFGIEFLNKHVGADGRVHTTFHQLLAATGRISSTPNLQNIPKDQRYRRCFIPAPGYKFIIADYSQIEPRLSAQVSQDAVYLAAFREHDDLYLRVAEALFGERPDLSTPEGKQRRTVVKVIVLGLAYRMGPGLLRDAITLALEAEIVAGTMEPPTFFAAYELWKRFFEIHAGVHAYQNRCADLAHPGTKLRGKLYDEYLGKTVTWIEAPCGRKRFFRPESKTTYTEAPNAPIQGGSATMMKIASLLVQQDIERLGLDAGVVNLIHDEGVWEVREDQAMVLSPIVKQRMEEAGRLLVKDVPVIAEYPEGIENGICDWWAKEAA